MRVVRAVVTQVDGDGRVFAIAAGLPLLGPLEVFGGRVEVNGAALLVETDAVSDWVVVGGAPWT